MDEDRRRAIEWDCTRTLTGFINALDAGDYETMAGLMAENGVWMRPGGDAVGPSGLLEAMKDRPRGLIVRHVISNVLIEAIDEDNATGITYLTVYRHRGPPPGERPGTPRRGPYGRRLAQPLGARARRLENRRKANQPDFRCGGLKPAGRA